MTAKEWMDVVQLVLALGAGVFVLVKGWQSWLEHEFKKAELEYNEAVAISNNELELAKHNSLTAAQVADMLKSYKEVIGDLEEMKINVADIKKSGEDKTKGLIDLINKIEHMVEQLTQNFTEFLMGKAR